MNAKRMSMACATMLLLWGAAASAHTSMDDAAILGIFDYANTADIETASLALTRSGSDDIKVLAKMVASDHQAVRRMGRELASKLAIEIPAPDPASLKQHSDALAVLKTKRGKEFDHAYLRHEIQFHQSVIDAINAKLLPAISNAEFKELVKKVLPGFRHHLDATQALAAKQGIDAGTQ